MTQVRLKRTVGLGGAVVIGLGSIVGTGVFYGLAVGAQVGGVLLIPALMLAGLLALFNGLSSAQLAAAHPVSGGTYEYGYKFLSPTLGFAAGWLFLCAKSASAAAAAVGFASYTLYLAGVTDRVAVGGLAAVALLTMTVLAASGLRRSNRVNAALVLASMGALALLVVLSTGGATVGTVFSLARQALTVDGLRPLAASAAVMFVAFTGYGRIATMGEEVVEPSRTIPRAVVLTLLCSLCLYVAVAVAALGVVGSAGFAKTAGGTSPPLVLVASRVGQPWLGSVVSLGAILAMLGVTLNLLLGLSRVVLAMARRGDLPASFARIDEERQSPKRAVYAVGVLAAVLAAYGDFTIAWSFSAFTVLIYYGLTNLAALRLPIGARKFPRVISVLGLLGCGSLALAVDRSIWFAGVTLLTIGLVLRVLFRTEGAE